MFNAEPYKNDTWKFISITDPNEIYIGFIHCAVEYNKEIKFLEEIGTPFSSILSSASKTISIDECIFCHSDSRSKNILTEILRRNNFHLPKKKAYCVSNKWSQVILNKSNPIYFPDELFLINSVYIDNCNIENFSNSVIASEKITMSNSTIKTSKNITRVTCNAIEFDNTKIEGILEIDSNSIAFANMNEDSFNKIKIISNNTNLQFRGANSYDIDLGTLFQGQDKVIVNSLTNNLTERRIIIPPGMQIVEKI